MPEVVTVTELAELLSTGGWPSRLLTLRDWDDLPEDELYKVEVSEGVLHIVPNAHPRHQWATTRLLLALTSALPSDLRCLPECDVLLTEDPLTVRGPDVLVVTSDAFAQGEQRFRGSDLLLAVEIISPGSRRTDRVTKASEYAEAGIPDYWIVDLAGPATLTHLTLGPDDGYRIAGEHTGRVTLEVASTRVPLDLDTLVG